MTTGYGNTTRSRTGTNGLAVAGLVCGVVGVFVLNFILGPLALIFGGVGLRNANRGASGRGMALASVILGAFDIILFVVLLVVASNNGGLQWHVSG
ncbi:protein of unknown function [Streptomyces sp. DvalAA-14]|uniref:DUF4190 domain-containing protein n=1 Tax=unclassified Streptomyces TaxID=2593676 RepID=UPI00081B50B4|nr:MULTISPECIES: DUF4190 domain-containing protein [unclassified Streptomyces]MYS21305.1 DUF4190 domain-containing protein [Streptomyces sp. SID4948]SCD89376.1 protein of unknown function [Streptomyces sp. DvalAA-14]